MNMMTRSEREDLQRLVRQREKVLKSAAKLNAPSRTWLPPTSKTNSVRNIPSIR